MVPLPGNLPSMFLCFVPGGEVHWSTVSVHSRFMLELLSFCVAAREEVHVSSYGDTVRKQVLGETARCAGFVPGSWFLEGENSAADIYKTSNSQQNWWNPPLKTKTFSLTCSESTVPAALNGNYKSLYIIILITLTCVDLMCLLSTLWAIIADSLISSWSSSVQTVPLHAAVMWCCPIKAELLTHGYQCMFCPRTFLTARLTCRAYRRLTQMITSWRY